MKNHINIGGERGKPQLLIYRGDEVLRFNLSLDDVIRLIKQLVKELR